jgi:molecular chaperone HscB
MKKVDVDVGNLSMFDPFEILHLEKSYSLDLTILEKNYFEEQKKTHPDQFFKATEGEKAKALKQSILVNQAYLTLKNPLLRAEYLLREEGIDTLADDPSFLGKVMTWNERLESEEDLKPELLHEETQCLRNLEKSFILKDYEKARTALYQLTYIQKLLKQGVPR